MEAPGMTAPVVSATVPIKRALSAWAKAQIERLRRARMGFTTPKLAMASFRSDDKKMNMQLAPH
jgi:hypothetical protein